MFGSLTGGAPLIAPVKDLTFTRHELGRLADEGSGLVPMARLADLPRLPPPFPLAAYLVMVRGQ